MRAFKRTMIVMFRLSLAVSALALASVTFAQSKSIVGTWNGKLTLVQPKGADGKLVPVQGAPPNVSYKMIVKKDGTFFTTLNGTPDKKPHTTEGKWTLKGTQVTLTIEKRDGKPDKSEPRTRILVLDPTGKRMATSLQQQTMVTGPDGKPVKPPPGMTPPAVMIVFVRA